MNDITKLKKTVEIKTWLDQMEIKNYTINNDLTVDVNGDVHLSKCKLKTLPIVFNKVFGGFYCYENELTSLNGCPREVGGEFDCEDNNLTSLDWCPDCIHGGFKFSGNKDLKITTYPKQIGDDVRCNNSNMTSLTLIHNFEESWAIDKNPCTYIYHELGFTIEAHIESILLLDENPLLTMSLLKDRMGLRFKLMLRKSSKLRKMCKDL